MKKIKLLSLTLAASLIFSAMPVSANTQYTDSAHEVINIDTPISNDNNSNCDVYAEIGSEFKVTIPKKIVLNGATKSGTYQVTVEGDIAGNEKITVKPDSTFTLYSKNLPDVTAQVSQDKIYWKCNEILSETKIVANGLIGASQITAGAWNGSFNFNISLKNNSINVQATDENDNNLNASAENIVDEEKEILLEELDKSGLANKEEVDAIIEVESDDFENLAKTIFDVSDIAKPGDQVIVLHYNETTQEWEYVSTETVADDGTVTVYMDSYSPVAFVKVENGATEHIHRHVEKINTPSCTEDGSKVYTCACGNTYTDIIDKIGHNYITYSTNGTQHWKACANGCGTAIDTGNHADLNNDSYCDTCNYKGTIVYTYHTHSGNTANNSGCYTAINYYDLSCGMSTSTVTGYYTNCGYSQGQAIGSYLSCSTPASTLTCTQSTASYLSCTTPTSKLTCTQSTSKVLTCTQSTDKVLVCTTPTSKLTCTKAVHSHGNSCYKTTYGGHSTTSSHVGSVSCPTCKVSVTVTSYSCGKCGASATSSSCGHIGSGSISGSCSGNATTKLTCTTTVHSHGTSCYTTHTHGTSCYTQHSHGSSCYTQHSHGTGCYATHTHSTGCYSAHSHGSGCYTTHSHSSGCYTTYYHTHSGSSSSGTGCYGGKYYHSHSGNSSSGGGCYGKAIYKLNCGMTTETVISQYTKFD